MDIVDIETSVISHATARLSSDPTTLALQQQAKRWLTEQRPLYEVVTSQLVIDEASLGDPDAAKFAPSITAATKRSSAPFQLAWHWDDQ
jgi:hypothetical protein